jgi:uncharacterized protein (TIGR02453 family)
MLNQSHKFLLNINNNNNREWFHKNKPLYQAAKEEFQDFVASLLNGMSDFEDLGGIEAKKCIYRINRDLRFTPDKTPYNSHFSALIAIDGRRTKRAPYYFKIKPDGQSVIAGGVWEGRAALINTIRQEIDYGLNEFNEIINNKEFISRFGVIEGVSLKRAPKGYDEDHALIRILKLKQFLVHHNIDKHIYLSDSFHEYLIESFLILKPFLDFMNKPLDEYFSREELT